MNFVETKLRGAFIVEMEKLEDERGFFARTFCRREFETRGLTARIAQCNISYNAKKGTLRGMHYQTSPVSEVKLIRCTSGAIYDVIVDLRPTSATFKKWVAVDLTAENRRMLYVPGGFAHGFQTLVENTEVFYQMSEFYCPEAARGIRWDDPEISVKWPLPNPILSDRDRAYPDYSLKMNL